MMKKLQHIGVLMVVILSTIFSHQSIAQSQTGEDFWFAFPKNYSSFGENVEYKVFVVSQYCIDSAYLEAPGFNYKEYFSVEAGEFFEISLPVLINGQEIAHVDEDFIREKGFHLNSPKPVSVFVLAGRQFSSDGETIIPAQRLGNEYILSNRSNNGSPPRGLITATEDNTTINIQYFDFGGPDNTTITLDKYQTFVFENQSTCEGDYPAIINCNTITGARVTSNKPIAVFSTVDCGSIGSCGNCDVMYAMHPAVQEWGNHYVTGQILERNEKVDNCRPQSSPNQTTTAIRGSGDYVEIVGPLGAVVDVNSATGTTSYTIASPAFGDFGYGYIFLEVPENLPGDVGEANLEITSNRNIQVTQYSKGQYNDENASADPEALTVFPIDQWEDSYFFYPIRTATAQALEVFIMVEDVGSPLPSTTIEINGTNIGANNWVSLTPTSTYKYKRVTFSNFDASLIRSTSGAPIGTYFFARAERETAFFSGGFGPIQNLTLCEQCGQVDIKKTGSVCLGSELQFEPRFYTFTVPTGLNYSWNFGDGTTSNLKNPTKIYDQIGEYKVTLTVSDRDCELVVEKTVYINDIQINARHSSPSDSICPGVQVNLFGDTTLTPGGVQEVEYTNSDTVVIPDNEIFGFWDGRFGFGTSKNDVAYSEIVITDNFSPGTSVDSICLNINHPRVTDLQLYLYAPNGSIYELVSNPSTQGRGNFRQTCFSPSATLPINNELPPFTGNFVPVDNPFWSEISTYSPKGIWGLGVGDNGFSANGEIIDWSIFVSTPMSIARQKWTPNALFADSSLNPNSFIPVGPEGPFNVSLQMTDYSGCTGYDTLSFYLERSPRNFGGADTTICSISDSLDMSLLYTPALNKSGTFTTFTPGDVSIFEEDYIPIESSCDQEHTIFYEDLFRCGTDRATISITNNCLPILDEDTLGTVCQTEESFDLITLIPDADTGGEWINKDNLTDIIQYDPGTIYPENIAVGTYAFQYTLPTEGCPVDTINVDVLIKKQPNPGRDSSITICESKTLINLFGALGGNPDVGGTWVDIDGTGALNPNGTLNPFGLPSDPAGNSFDFQYSFANQNPCVDSSAVVTVFIQYAPRIELVPDFNILCRDSSVNFTMNMTGVGPFDVIITDGTNNYPTNGVNVNSGATFSAPLSETTTFTLQTLLDDNNPQCSFVEDYEITIEVYDPIIAELADEICALDNSYFIPIVEVSGGDGIAYTYDLFINGTLVKQGANVQGNILDKDTIPNGTEYEYRFYDLSNCPTSQASFFRPRQYCECKTDAGEMNRTQLFEFCEYEDVLVTDTIEAFLEPEDTLFYILHTSGGLNIGTILDSNETPTFPFDPAYEYETTYYVSSIAGDRLGDGLDPLDTCFSVSRGTPVVWRERPRLVNITPDIEICQGEFATIDYEITGTPPFIIDVRKVTSSTTIDTTLTLVDNEGTILLNPNNSTSYQLQSIADGNANITCSTPLTEVFNVNVNLRPEATFQVQADEAICEGSNADITVLLSGVAPFQLIVVENNVQKTITSNTNTVTFQYNTPTTLQLLAISDKNCEGSVEGISTKFIDVKKAPNASVDIAFQESCGLVSVISATPSHGDGTWTAIPGADGVGTISVDDEPTTQATVPNPGTFKFRWTERNPPCPESFADIDIKFRRQPTPYAGEDDTVCDKFYNLQAVLSKGGGLANGYWLYEGDQTATFDDVFDPKTKVTVDEAGSYVFTWHEDVDGICVATDNVVITFFFDLQIIPLDTICSADANSFDFKFKITGGDINNLSVNAEPVITEPGTYIVKDLSNSVPFELTAVDNGKCGYADTLVVDFSCPCISLGGTFNHDTLRVCAGDDFFVDYNSDHVKDQNDSLLFVIKDTTSLTKGNFIFSSGYNDFNVPASSVIPGKVYYLFAMVGNKSTNSSFGINLLDRCLSAQDAVPVIFSPKVVITTPSQLFFCEGEPTTLRLDGLPPGTYDIDYIDNTALKTQTVTAPNAVLTFNPQLGTSYLQIGAIRGLDNDACVEVSNSLIIVNHSPKPTANIIFDDEICANEEVVYEIEDDGTPLKTIQWDLGNGVGKEGPLVLNTYNAGVYTISVFIENIYGCTNEIVLNNAVTVQEAPTPNFNINGMDTNLVCFPDSVGLSRVAGNPNVSSWKWNINGSIFPGNQSNIEINPTQRGNYTVRLDETTSFGCTGFTLKRFTVSGPSADFDYHKDVICAGEEITMEYLNASNVDSIQWTLFNGASPFYESNNRRFNLEVGKNPVITGFDVELQLFDTNGCSITYTDFVGVHHINVDFKLGFDIFNFGDSLCIDWQDILVNQSNGADEFFWDLGPLGTSINTNFGDVNFDRKGEQEVTLTARNTSFGCEEMRTKSIFVRPLPFFSPIFDTLCIGQEITIDFGHNNVIWADASNEPFRFEFEQDKKTFVTFSPEADITFDFKLIGTDQSEAKGCENYSLVNFDVFDYPAPAALPPYMDTLIATADSIYLEVPSIENTIYTWESTTDSVCNGCTNTYFRAFEETYITLTQTDIYGCYEDSWDIRIRVEDRFGLDMPDAFTPNGDGINDIIYPEGVGLIEILSFEVYNRYGQQVFKGSGIHPGWDGYYKGKLQPSGDYTYKVSAMLRDEVTKTRRIVGTFQLFR